MNKKRLLKTLSGLKSVLFYLVLFIIIATVVDFFRGRDLPENTIPDTIYSTLTEQQINILERSQDELMVVYFWATWCGPCKVTSPSVEQLAKHFSVTSIAMASGDNHTLQAYIKDKEYSFAVINDNEQMISQQWGVNATPFILFVRHGKIVGHTAGASFFPGLYARALAADSL